MNRLKNPLLFLLTFCLISFAQAQDTLPRFSVRNLGNNRFIIDWINPFPQVKQISIQRSHDSLQGYKTILSVADPNAVQNGYADTKSPNDHMYYRLFYVLDGAKFYFTEAKKPVWDTARRGREIVYTQKDPMGAVKPNDPEIKKRDMFLPSFYVYTNRDGYVFINLPDADRKKYTLKFFEDDDTFLFEIKNIKETALTLDKANFYHAGWFRFELYNDDKLVERHKFYLAKDF